MEEIRPPASALVLKIARIIVALVIAVVLAVFLPWHFNIPTPGPLVASFVIKVPAVPRDWGPNLPFMLVALFVDCAFFFVTIWYSLGLIIYVARRPTKQ
jgi:hypothetical protein